MAANDLAAALAATTIEEDANPLRALPEGVLGLSLEKGETGGKLIRNGAGSRVLRDSPWVAFGPITVMFLTLASINYIGDYLRDFFNVRETGLGR